MFKMTIKFSIKRPKKSFKNTNKEKLSGSNKSKP